MCPTSDDLQILGIAMLIGMFCCYKLGQWNGVKFTTKKIEKLLPKISDVVTQQQTDIKELEERMIKKERALYTIYFTRCMN